MATSLVPRLLGSWGAPRVAFILPSSIEVPKFPYTKYAYKPKDKADRPPSLYPLADENTGLRLCDATIPGQGPLRDQGLGWSTAPT